MKLQNHDFERLARYLSGECSDKEKAEVNDWLKANPEQQQWMAAAQKTWQIKQKTEDLNIEALWKEILKKTGMQERTPYPRKQAKILFWPVPGPAIKILRIAALFIMAVTLSYWGVSYFLSEPKMEEIAVANGKQLNMTLSDGTEIWLDAGSHLRYPKKFSIKTRDVILEGEGFFKVAKDPSRSFIVHAQGASIQVLGTQFNVRAWNSSCCVKVAVVEGKVAFNGEKASQKDQVILCQGQMSMLSIDLIPTPPVPMDPVKETGWMRGEIELTDAPLTEVLDQLMRWYDVSFVCSDSTRLQEHVSVHIHNNSLDDILEMVSLLSGFNVTQNEKTIILN